jgi:hypothetical protein
MFLSRISSLLLSTLCGQEAQSQGLKACLKLRLTGLKILLTPINAFKGPNNLKMTKNKMYFLQKPKSKNFCPKVIFNLKILFLNCNPN